MSGLATTGLLAPKKTVLYCSFCGKSQHEVELLIRGPTVQICDECTALCAEIVVQKRAAKDRKEASDAVT